MTDGPTKPREYVGVGTQLRERRMALGLTVEQVSGALKLKPRHLLALERGDVDAAAHGTTYALGYLRSYAGYLGLDGEATVNAFKAELDREPELRPMIFPVDTVQEAKFPTGRLLSLSAILVVLAYGGYYYISRSAGPVAEVVPPVPVELVDNGADPAPPNAGGEATNGSSPGSAYAAQPPGVDVSPLAPPEPAAPSAAAQAYTTPPAGEIAAPSAAAASAPTQLASAPAPEAGSIRVVLHAKSDAWVQIQASGNELLFTKILRSGESYQVPPRDGMTLVTGNAGALEVLVDGRSLGVLGADGAVKRNISLDPERLLDGSAIPPG